MNGGGKTPEWNSLTKLICAVALTGLLALACVPLMRSQPDWPGFLRNLGVELLGLVFVIAFFFRGKLGLRWENPSPDETADQRDVRWTRNVVTLFTILGVLGLVILSLSGAPSKGWTGASRVFGTLTIYAGGCFGVGALVGFLFGIPRSLQGKIPNKVSSTKDGISGNDPDPPGRDPLKQTLGSGPAEVEDKAIYATNTNLEEISDWLTKIIVGLGLINLKVIPGKLKALAWYFSEYGNGPIPESASLALILYFSTCGFFLAYLMTRLFLTGAFSRADLAAANRRSKIIASATVAMQEAETSRHSEQGEDIEPLIEKQLPRAQSIAAIASTLDKQSFRRELEALAKQYETLRVTMKPSDERTVRLEGIASGIRSYALASYSLLEHFIGSNSPGERLAAVLFLEVKPDCEYANWLAERFTEDKPFIQYHAAVALRIANQKLGSVCKEQIRAAVQAALKALGDDKQTTDRYKVLQQILTETA